MKTPTLTTEEGFTPARLRDRYGVNPRRARVWLRRRYGRLDAQRLAARRWLISPGDAAALIARYGTRQLPAQLSARSSSTKRVICSL